MNLNQDQKRIFSRIIEDVHKGKKIDPLLLFVCGAAGTGKSVLINELVSEIGVQYVISCAPTALAARNINGSTIHSSLKLGISDKADDSQVVPPHPYLKLLIIDEISMCDAKLFTRVEKRMRQITRNKDTSFGGCTVVLFGDLMQIPPVNGAWIFNSPIWRERVQYDELEIVMRQEKDPIFAGMLKRWRVGKVNPEDKDFLDDRKIPFPAQFELPWKNQMVLVHTNKSAEFWNREITSSLFEDTELYTISDTIKGGNIHTTRRDRFQLGLGSRVMIDKNLNHTFVNGDIGLVKRVKSDGAYVTSLDLTLLSSGSTQTIPMSSAKIDDQKWRFGFAISPAYAVTYHKCQGQTLDHVYLSTEKPLPAALFYVGASRVRTSDDITTMSYGAHNSIHADPDAVEEYKRLRTNNKMSALPL